MDKYEYQVCADQIKNYIAEKKYVEAMEIADTIDWRRVKSVSMLCTVSEIYKVNKRYEESRDILLLAYERYPNGRMIVYALCELSIKMNDIVQAVEYYKEFVRIAPGDTGSYILLYKIYDAQEVSIEERINVLEEFKKRDYREKWAYELALLYHKIGQEKRCIDECDELILWFGEGKYVKKAMELKMQHTRLSSEQQAKYEGNVLSESTGAGDSGKDNEEEPAEEKKTMTAVPAGNPSEKYSTKNLELELQQSMEEYLSSGEASPDGEAASKAAEDDGLPPEPGLYNENTEETETVTETSTDEGIEGEAMPGMMQGPGQEAPAGAEQGSVPGSMPGAMQGTMPAYSPGAPVAGSEQAGMVVQQVENNAPAKTQEFVFDMNNPYVQQFVSSYGNENIAEENTAGGNIAGGNTAEGSAAGGSTGGESATGESVAEGNAAGGSTAGENTVGGNTALEGRAEENTPGEIKAEEDKAYENNIKKEKKASFSDRFIEVSKKYENILGEELNGQLKIRLPDPDMVERQITGQIDIDQIMKIRGAETPEEDKPVLTPADTPVYSPGKDAVPGEKGEDEVDVDADTYTETYTDALKEELSEAAGEEEGLLKEAGEEGLSEEVSEEEPSGDTGAEEVSEETGEEEEPLEDTGKAKTLLEAAGIYEEDGQMEAGTPGEEEEETSEEEAEGEQAYEEGSEDGEYKDPDGEPEEEEADSEEDSEEEASEINGRVSYELDDYGEVEEIEDIEQPDEVDDIIKTSNLPIEEIERYNAMAEQQALRERQSMEEAEYRQGYDESGRMKHPSYMVLQEERKSRRDFTEEEFKLFGRYDKIEPVKAQIVDVADAMSLQADTGNVVVTGEEVACRKTLAIDFVRALQAMDQNFTGKVAKISGEALNKKNIPSTLKKLSNGALIVEDAEGLSAAALTIIAQTLERDVENILVILEGEGTRLNRLLEINPGMFEMIFNARIDIKEFSNDELVAYARGYAREQEHSIDEMGTLALYTRIGELQTLDHKVTVDEVKELIDKAIVRVDKVSISHLLDVLVSKRYDNDDFIIIREKDFLPKGKRSDNKQKKKNKKNKG